MDGKEALRIIELVNIFISSDKETETAFQIAQDAIKTQIPRKPNLVSDGDCNGEEVYDTWECPNCGQTYGIDEEHYFCPDCGQHINWSQTDESD